MKHVSAILFAGVAIGCGGSGTAGSPADGGAGDGPSSIADGGSGPNEGGTGSDGSAAASCVPAIPQTAWTSPYAGWTRGIPTDPEVLPDRRMAAAVVARDRAPSARGQHLRRQQRRDRSARGE